MVHLSLILDYYYFCIWALEHKDVLRVLRLQTLEINSMVKDPTYLDPSLVSGVKYSSHTILQSGTGHIHQQRKRQCAASGGFQQEGAPSEGEQFDLGRGEGFWA
jgi:hypothetical protein